MRAYLLGYNHGKNDGYYSTLIERGGSEKLYDESLDVEYVAIDTVLEIIDTVNDDLDFGTKAKGVALSIKEKVLALQVG